MPTYIKKPVKIEAVRWTGDNEEEIKRFVGESAVFTDGALFISTLEGLMSAQLNDMIIRGVEGEFYPCAHKIFEKTYDYVQ